MNKIVSCFSLVYKFAILRKKSDIKPDFLEIFFKVIPPHGAKRVCAPVRRG